MRVCKLRKAMTCNVQERPGLVVLTIELEGALAQMPGNLSPSRMWSPYREPLAKFLNKYSVDVSISSVRLLLCTEASSRTHNFPDFAVFPLEGETVEKGCPVVPLHCCCGCM